MYGQVTGDRFPIGFYQSGIDGQITPAHVARHGARFDRHENQLPLRGQKVEDGAVAFRVTGKARPAGIKIETFRHAVAPLVRKANHVGGNRQDIVANDDLVSLCAVGMSAARNQRP